MRIDHCLLRETILDYGIEATLSELISLVELNYSTHPDCIMTLAYLIKANHRFCIMTEKEKIQLKRNHFNSVEVTNE